MPQNSNFDSSANEDIPMKELRDAMRDGRLSIQQEMRHEDGSTTTSVIFGNGDDGIDRSVHIFGTLNDVLKPAIICAKQVRDENPNTDHVFRMDNADADYEMTFDDTTIPLMHVVVCTKDSVQVRRYTRDEHRSYGKPIAEDTYSFTDGQLLATTEEIQADHLRLFAFSAHAIRALLEERGLLQKLKELGNRGSGVILSEEDDEINIRIVCGRSRPALPCMLFGGLFAQSLNDTIMMRPYADELIDDVEMPIEKAISEAENGNLSCMEQVALAYLRGDGVEHSPEKAVYWFTKLAQQNDANGQFNIGLLLAKGYGTERDFEKAAYWMQRAADNGDADAPVLAEKYTKAAEATKKAGAGDAQAQADLAAVLMELAGSLEEAGVDDDYAMAFDLAERSAEQHNGDGIWVLALAYEHGRGVRKSRKKAIALYKQGADLGHAACQHNLACCYMNGDGLPEDHHAAFALMQKSAAQGYGLAMRDLGRCYQFANGCTGNMQTALEWYSKAAEVLHDPELERRVEAFRVLAREDPHWSDDYPEDDGSDTSTGVFDASPIIRANLKAAGKCADNETLGNMSVDDAYTAMSGQIDMGSDIPAAQPLESQHSHLDFLLGTKMAVSALGGALRVNQTGTEYSFKSIMDMAEFGERNEPLGDILRAIAQTGTDTFELAETAHQMAKLFRLDAEFFDAAHDREQEIENGHIQCGIFFHGLRSFAWTLQAYCKKEKIQPADLSYEKIEELLSFISDRNFLNYTANSYSPVICSGDDIHVFYIPDAVSATMKKQLRLEAQMYVEGNGSDSNNVRSLDGLRQELAYMYPAMQTIYSRLEATRDHEVPLTGDAADVLYAWCSMTYAARNPIFSEDGLVTCWWEHPDEQLRWEREMKIAQLESAMEQGEKWLERHRKDISEKAHITFNNQAFVFVGVNRRAEWLDILQAVVRKGGLHRTAVSGKTNYVVCDPPYAGDSQVKRALEQRLKGKDVKIVLLDDLLAALHMTIKTLKEQKDELLEKPQEESQEARVKPAPISSAADLPLPSALTYTQGIRQRGDGYEMDIPDGFVVKTDAGDASFTAYLPSEENPDDPDSSRFVIFDGKREDSDVCSQFKTMAEFRSITGILCAATCRANGGGMIEAYERPELPGAIATIYKNGTLHAILKAGVNDHLQSIRVRIGGISRMELSGYRALVRMLFDHVRADKPVVLLEQPDAVKYIQMDLSGKLPKEWTACVKDHAMHITIARDTSQNLLLGTFLREDEGQRNVLEFRKKLKDLLRDVSSDAESVLKRAEYVCAIKSAQYPEHKALSSMRGALAELVALADQKISLDDDLIEVKSAYAARVRERLKKPAHQAIELLLAEESWPTEEERAVLSELGAEARESYKQAEKKRKAEEQAARKARAEAAQREAKAEEALRLAEDAARQEAARQRAQQIQSLRDVAHKDQEKLMRSKTRREVDISRCTENIAALGEARAKLGFFFHLKEKRQIDEKIEALKKRSKRFSRGSMPMRSKPPRVFTSGRLALICCLHKRATWWSLAQTALTKKRRSYGWWFGGTAILSNCSAAILSASEQTVTGTVKILRKR